MHADGLSYRLIARNLGFEQEHGDGHRQAELGRLIKSRRGCKPILRAPWFILSWLPIALGIAFNRDAHAIVMPNRRVPTTAGGSPRWYRDAKVWASAVDEAMAAEACLRRRTADRGGEQ